MAELAQVIAEQIAAAETQRRNLYTLEQNIDASRLNDHERTCLLAQIDKLHRFTTLIELRLLDADLQAGPVDVPVEPDPCDSELEAAIKAIREQEIPQTQNLVIQWQAYLQDRQQETHFKLLAWNKQQQSYAEQLAELENTLTRILAEEVQIDGQLFHVHQLFTGEVEDFLQQQEDMARRVARYQKMKSMFEERLAEPQAELRALTAALQTLIENHITSKQDLTNAHRYHQQYNHHLTELEKYLSTIIPTAN